MRKPIALLGLLGLVGCFLPLVGGFSMFDLRHFEALPVYLLMAAFLVPMIAGLADNVKAAAAVGTLGFGYVLFKFGFGTLDLFIDGRIGGKAIAVAAVAGFACSLLAFAEKQKA
jgi:FtsH-binding integral membrane protein